MKRNILALLLLIVGLNSCDWLNEYPKDKISPQDYFRTETDLQLFTNPFYSELLKLEPYKEQSDHCVQISLSDELRGGNSRTVPGSGGGWSWSMLRRINTVLAYSANCQDAAVVAKYNGVARFFRAYFYFEKVKRFGDVPWIDKELTESSPELMAPRDSREFIMGKMLEDIEFAINNLPAGVSPYRVNKWSALALKAQFCLYEGTYRKYHNIQLEGRTAEDYLLLAADAAKQVMESGLYQLASDYLTLFAQQQADPKEYILAIDYDFGLQVCNNSTAYATMPTQGCPGLTKMFVDCFVMKDGKRFTDKEGWDKLEFKEQVANRDPRLACITVTPGYKRIGGKKVLAPDYGSSSTGYQVAKFVMDSTLAEVNRVDKSYNDMPVYRLGEIYLIYAEALAEYGSITQDDLDISINLLRKRVGMPNLSLSEANAKPCTYMSSEAYGYRNVSGTNKGVILEIRRERGVEMALEGRRWDDLMRWKEGLCINQAMYGPYFPGPGTYDLTGDNIADVNLWKGTKPADKEGVSNLEIGTITGGVILSGGTSGYVDTHADVSHVFNEERDYLYPIPINDITLNPNLKQNPGWYDIKDSEEGEEGDEEGEEGEAGAAEGANSATN